jgi:hypothetical protein
MHRAKLRQTLQNQEIERPLQIILRHMPLP